MNQKQPLSEEDNVDHPIQFYAATKRSNELIAHSYSHLFSLPTTDEIFTVYGLGEDLTWLFFYLLKTF